MSDAATKPGTDPQNRSKHSASWFARNWQWLIPSISLACIVFCCGLPTGVVYLFRSLENSESPFVAMPVKWIEQSDEANEALGGPIEFGEPTQFDVFRDGTPFVVVEFEAVGPDGSGDVSVYYDVKRGRNKAIVTSALLTLAKQDREIDLLASSGLPEYVDPAVEKQRRYRADPLNHLYALEDSPDTVRQKLMDHIQALQREKAALQADFATIPPPNDLESLSDVQTRLEEAKADRSKELTAIQRATRQRLGPDNQPTELYRKEMYAQNPTTVCLYREVSESEQEVVRLMTIENRDGKDPLVKQARAEAEKKRDLLRLHHSSWYKSEESRQLPEQMQDKIRRRDELSRELSALREEQHALTIKRSRIGQIETRLRQIDAQMAETRERLKE